ncbi:cytochrome c oxidase subunit 4 [Yimella sp. cx-51]|uniref:aa3-type cytochrome oxidase subunit IV n=1 Tax=Yimella sp. cx-51 TaxID=2770551 RepID=UPI00165E34A7|nr:cytochrome c oxidase subunit 4 [Yimella sp. cx-51]MBC9957592.1 cytochrome c oxidase subunit 4 [Yimella sp. cx-51]MBD2758634.1 cytochrome c oxidase subunit 4 [Yimella sp. cx-573]QTH37046.1 cytochrome c oxidase subunit 4 [Yimella sp. cx-51]
MKTEARLFYGVGIFITLVFLLYTFWTMNDVRGIEPVGVAALLLTAGLFFMCGFFLSWSGKKSDPRPDDDPDGEISEIEGDFGFFAPHSWWPLILGFACALLMFGAAVGWWFVIFSVPVLLIAVIGWTFEFFRGENSV